MQTDRQLQDAPLRIPPLPRGDGESPLELHKFAITENGFLPECEPLSKLPDSYYEPWELIINDLPDLIKNGIRKAIENLPILSTDRLTSDAEWRRAYAMLAYMTHAYVWGGDKPKEVLLPQLTIPFLRASKHLELPPILTYAATCLWNFSCIGDDFSGLENLKTIFSFTGTESEAWFTLISVAIEAQSTSLIQAIVAATDAIQSRDFEVATGVLRKLQQCIKTVNALLKRMPERCDPATFYYSLRPFLAGSKNMEAAGLPRGIYYDEGSGKGEWRQLRGGSNGQSSLIQLFDIVLGIKHDVDSSGESFYIESRAHMPGPHRRFLTHIGCISTIREMALEASNAVEHIELRNAYRDAAEALSALRTEHIQIVARYITSPSKQPWRGIGHNLASPCSCKGSIQLTGTGGTMLIPFLKGARDTTQLAGRLRELSTEVAVK